MIEFPERPYLLFPSLAKQLGVEAALLLGYLQERAQGQQTLVLSRDLIETELSFWSVEQVLSLLEQLMQQELIDAESEGAELRVQLHSAKRSGAATQSSLAELPVVEMQELPALRSGPAPTFGGHSGWRRTPSELDEIFAAAEQRKRQMREMTLDWRPSTTFFELLKRSSIDAKFAQNCLDEFIAYYVERGNQEANWDQRFLAWVKRAWRDHESRQARADRFSESGTGNEKNRQDSRENRKRVTAAIMDLKNLDW